MTTKRINNLQEEAVKIITDKFKDATGLQNLILASIGKNIEITGDIEDTISPDIIENVSDLTGLEVGQEIVAAGIPHGTLITIIDNNLSRIQISNDAFNTQVGQDLMIISAWGLQDIENKLHEFFERLNIATAGDKLLENIGDIVGLRRDSVDDDIYRRNILAQIGRNTSKCDPESMIYFMNELTEPDFIIYTEWYPAHIHLYAFGCTVVPTDLTAKLQLAAAAGVEVKTSAYAFLHPFGFAKGFDVNTGHFPTATCPLESKGFSSIANPAIGGKIVGIT